MYKLSLGHMFDLQASTFAALRLPAAGAAVMLSIGFVYALVMRIKKRHLEATLTTAVNVTCWPRAEGLPEVVTCSWVVAGFTVNGLRVPVTDLKPVSPE